MRPLLFRLTAVGLFAVCVLAVGPRASGFQLPEGGVKKFELNGVIKAIRPGFIQFIASSGDVWVVQVDAKRTNTKVTGHADPSWLRRGMFVEFENRFDRRGQPKTAVTALKIFTPTEKTQFGGTPLAERATDIVPQGEPDTINLRVTGRLMNYKDDRITVMAGSTPVTVPLSPILAIAVEVADYSLARPGDSIEVAGKYTRKGQGIADKVEIKGGAVFTAPKKQKR
jgi:hypothetical protein